MPTTRQFEQFPCRPEPGVAESCDEGRVMAGAVLRQHFEDDRAGKLGFWPAGDVGNAARGGHRGNLRAGSRRITRNPRQALGNRDGDVRIDEEDPHGSPPQECAMRRMPTRRHSTIMTSAASGFRPVEIG